MHDCVLRSQFLHENRDKNYYSRPKLTGTKHVDPDTGLIYFKYDFGYEFGILLPGEGKRTVASNKQSYNGQRKPGDIDVPIAHEFTNGYAKPKTYNNNAQNCHTFPRNKTGPKFGKTVKWEPTSESEYSEVEDFRSKPTNLLIPPASAASPGWDPTSPSPASLSPSLPSNYESMPGTRSTNMNCVDKSVV